LRSLVSSINNHIGEVTAIKTGIPVAIVDVEVAAPNVNRTARLIALIFIRTPFN
jgi:hypothetical protein